MDYENMAREYMEAMYQMRKRNAHKQIHDSLHGENFVLYFISHNEGNVIPSDISNEMGITSARVAAALNSLEKKGMITRKIDAEDRRRIMIELTDLGREESLTHYRTILNMTKNLLEYLGEDDSKDLIRIMKKLGAKGSEDLM